MANPKLLACDLSVPTYTWSEGPNTSYPVSNLKNGYPDIYSQSLNTDQNQWFVIDRGSALPADTLIVDGHNWSGIADTSINLQYNTPDDGTWGTPTNINADITPASDNVFAVSFNSVSKRYIRVVFGSTVALTAAPKIGNIYLGTALTFETTQTYGYFTNMPDFSEVTVNSRALDGRARSAMVAGPIRKHKINFDQGNVQTDTLKTAYLTFIETAKMNPFYYIDNNSAIYCVKWARGFNPYEAFRYNQNKIPDLQMESVLAA